MLAYPKLVFDIIQAEKTGRVRFRVLIGAPGPSNQPRSACFSDDFTRHIEMSWIGAAIRLEVDAIVPVADQNDAAYADLCSTPDSLARLQTAPTRPCYLADAIKSFPNPPGRGGLRQGGDGQAIATPVRKRLWMVV